MQEYDELQGIGWDWQSVDSSTVKAPFAAPRRRSLRKGPPIDPALQPSKPLSRHPAVGPAPTHRGKQGAKRSLLCDRRGIPLALVIEGANRHDMKLLAATLDAQGYERPEPTLEQPQNLCLDAGYDDDCVSGDLSLRGYEPHARLNPHNHKWYQEALKEHPPEPKPLNSLEPTKQPRRWVVERLFSWLNCSRRLMIRWEKLSSPYETFLKLACALICFHQCDHLPVFG